MKLLLISPDYASHYGPLAALGGAARRQGHRVVVATGPTLRQRVLADGFEHRRLVLGRGSNSGATAEDESLRAFFEATRSGAVATLRHQALERGRDLLHDPVGVAQRILELLASEDPDSVVVDHVSFASTLALHASGRRFITLVPGHPGQLPTTDERYGIPAEWPSTLQPGDADTAELRAIVDDVATRFTAAWNRALASVAPDRTPVDDAFRVHGDRVLFNSDLLHHDPRRRPDLPADHRFVGPLVRSEDLPPEFENWSVDDGRPRVYVALGTFLSHRSDVLVTIASAISRIDVRAAIACGPTPAERLGPHPSGWIIDAHLPQVALIRHADVVVCHGGNNSVQEARHAGVRQVILPFSTDQFSIGRDAERCDSGRVLDPNELDEQEFSATVQRLVTLGRMAALPRPTDDEIVEALTLDSQRPAASVA